jgi:hypothetical protein
VAVGSRIDAAGRTEPLAETWNQHAWTVVSVPVPTGATGADLLGVDCLTGADCTAVGEYDSSAGEGLPLAETWDGKVWSLRDIPNPDRTAPSYLTSVSCPTTTDCLAVGFSQTETGPASLLAEVWNGKVWTQSNPAQPAGGVDDRFTGVDCASATDCEVVGNYSTADGSGPALAEQFNGSDWILQTVANLVGAANSFLYAVTCPGIGSCQAVGLVITTSTTFDVLHSSLDNGMWSSEETAPPSGDFFAELDSLTCPSSSSCVATGYSEADSSLETSLAATWDGTAWTYQNPPVAKNSVDSNLAGVACASATACLAVGQYDFSTDEFYVVPSADGWNGKTWIGLSPPAPKGATTTELESVSCFATIDCTAVGMVTNPANTQVAFSESSTAQGWKAADLPLPKGQAYSQLQGVSCPTADGCVAVGYYATSRGVLRPLVESADGSTWQLQSAPLPTGTSSGHLNAVHCASPDFCVAVGDYVNSLLEDMPLVETFDGTAWTADAVSVPTGAIGSDLYGVDCPSDTGCVAVGAYLRIGAEGEEVALPLAETFSDSAWTEQTPRAPKSSADTELRSVSCTSAGSCEAAGYAYFDTGGISVQHVLVETLQVDTWSIASTLTPDGADEAGLSGVSCASDSSCIAVGYYIDNATAAYHTAAETWNGTSWAAVLTPLPSGSIASQLDGVSCVSPTECTAVGQTTLSAGITTTLVESS